MEPKAARQSTLAEQTEIERLLGAHTDEFRPGLANTIAGFIFAAIFAACGIAGIVIFFYRGIADEPLKEKVYAILLVAVICPILIFMGVGMFCIMRSHLSFRVYFCPRGFYYRCEDKFTAFGWHEVSHITETLLRESLPVVRQPVRQLMPKVSSRNYTVVRADGEEFTFDANCIAKLKHLAKLLRDNAEHHGIPWRVEEKSK